MKLIATDYDGTLKFKDERGYLSSNNQAIKLWQAQGNKIALVTGRSLKSIINEQAIYNYDFDYYLACNGAVFSDRNFNIISTQCIDHNLVIKLINFIQEYQFKNIILAGVNDRIAIENNQLDVAQDFLKSNQISQIVINFDHDEEIIDQIREKILENFELSALRNICCIDIVKKGIDKNYGVKLLKDYLSLNPNNIYCIGDSDNDLPMLVNYQGYAMNNAKDYIKTQVKYSVENLATLIDKLLNES